tara:strand:+ start:5673 stop:6587 length:915 start_codon:yes stop_codon:yes gene_type:complete
MSRKVELAGSLAIDKSLLTAVFDESTELALLQAQTDRTTSYAEGLYEYYVKTTYNINSHMQHHLDENTEDDAWSMSAISLTSATPGITATFDLPTGSKNIYAGTITANYDGGSGTFIIECVMNVDNAGKLTCSTSIVGEEVDGVTVDTVTGSINENVNKAQLAYWPIKNGTTDYSNGTAPTSPDSSDADILSAQLSVAHLNTHYADTLDGITDVYDSGEGTDLVTGWQIEVVSVAQLTDSSLSKFARDGGAASNGKAETAVFDGGDELVCKDSFTYEVEITDASGAVQKIRTAKEVHGVLVQSA